jgi:bifunctional DNA-binding transcriptional regulator/antitoxin component of YhaV-PrlF toxin-antitoxin module
MDSMSLDSSVATARKKSKSLRATIPEGIVVYLGLEVGDKLEWKMDMKGKDRIAIVKKKKRN